MKSPDVLFEVRAPRRPGDRHEFPALREYPGERELRGSAALLRRELLDVPDQREVLFEVRALEARGVAPPVVGSQVLEALDSPRQEAAPEWAVGDEGDAELATNRDDFVLRLAAPQRILSLQGRDRVDGAGDDCAGG